MNVCVKFFAIGKEIIGTAELDVELESGSTAADLIEKLKSDFPKFREVKSLLVAIGTDYVDLNQLLSDGDEVAIIPPVSGG